MAGDPQVLAFLAALPPAKRQPNLLFAAARYLLGRAAGLASLRALVAGRGPELAAVIRARRTQTNEPARCAVLLPALMLLPQPLALLEVGASAGLTLLPDRYSYDYAGHRITGTDPRAPVLSCEPRGPVPLPDRVPAVCGGPASISTRSMSPATLTCTGSAACCGPAKGREQRLAGAIAAARRDPPVVHRGDLLTDLPALARQAPSGATLVIYHSAVLGYLSAAERGQFAETVRGLDAAWLSNDVPAAGCRDARRRRGAVPDRPGRPHPAGGRRRPRHLAALAGLTDGAGAGESWCGSVKHEQGSGRASPCFAGRPNVGKSTLMNALVGAKVAITSSRPQTTRRAIRGIVHRPDAQLVIVDTPGLHRPRTLLGERLDSLARSTLTEVDVIGFCVPAPDRIGPGDKYLATELGGIGKTPVVAIITKTDQVRPEQVAAQLAAVAELGDWADLVPVSAVTGFQLGELADVLVSHLPPGQPLYPEGELTDEPEQVLVAELIREAALEGVRDELPHSIAVVVEEMGPRAGRDDLIDVYAQMYVERPSQKSIVIGAKGARLKDVGSRARHQIEALLGTKVYLDLRIKVAKNWQRDPRQLRRLGFYD